jgi:hypothetical protein
MRSGKGVTAANALLLRTNVGVGLNRNIPYRFCIFASRTPMNGIIGMTTLTLETELTRQQRENLVIVSHLAHSLLTIIDDILDISKSKFMNVLPFSSDVCVQNLISQADHISFVPSSRSWQNDD